MTNPLPGLFLIVVLIFIVLSFFVKKYSLYPVFLKPSNKKFDLSELLKNKNSTEKILAIDTYINEKSKYGENIEKLNSCQKTFLFIENLEREINNGGFNQFYFNSSRDFSQETLDALLEIKAQKTAKIVKKANSEFKNGIVPKDRIERLNELELIEEKAEETWNKCDSDFYKYVDNIAELLIDFVIKNKSKFEK